MSDARPFRESASYYADFRYRPSEAFFARLADELGWTKTDRVLDLGAGPAQLSTVIARHVGEVVVMDPEPAMIEEGRRRGADVPNLTFVGGGSDDLSVVEGPFAAVTIGSAFHWMGDQDRVLRELAELTDAVAIVSYGKEPPDPVEAWLDEPPWNAARDILARHAAPAPPRPQHDPYPEIFARSPFSLVEVVTCEYMTEARPSVDFAIGHLYSLSNAVARLGDQQDAFEADMRSTFAGADTTPFDVRVVDSALIARKP